MEFSINDYTYKVDEFWADLSLIQVCSLKGVMIPRFCYFSKLSIAGNCRMCLIEDGESAKLIASCAIPVSNELSVYTNTMKIRNTREAVLEFLLINHPLDCPICDQGGECDLQDQSVVFGGDRGRFYDFKRSVENKNCGPLIKTVMNRCIHCTRCVRFATEIAGVSSLGITGRGSSMQIGFYIQKLFNSEISGNVIDLCPVGASTSKPYAFTSRPWELRSIFTVDPTDSLCSSIRVDIRGTSVLRVLPRTNSFMNSDWISDRVRFFYDGLYRQRLSTPFIRFRTTLIPVSWKAVLYCVKKVLYGIFVFLFKQKKSFMRISLQFGPSETLETCFSIKNFLQKMSSSINYFFSEQDSNCFLSSSILACPEIIDLVCLSNVNLRYQSPVFNVFIREIYIKENVLILQTGSVPFNNFYSKHLGNVPRNQVKFSRGKFLMSSLFQKYTFPLILSQRKSLFFEAYTNLYQTKIWKGFFQFIPSVSNVQKKFLGVSEYPDISSNTLAIRYKINQNMSFSRFEGPSVFFYQGHHGGDLVGNLASFVFPAATFIESNSTFLNAFGMKQRANKAFSLHSFYNSRSPWKIIKMISYFFGIRTSEIKESRVGLVMKLNRNFPASGPFLNNTFANIAVHDFFIAMLPFSHNFSTPYQVESISLNSRVLSLCNSYMRLQLSFSLEKQNMR